MIGHPWEGFEPENDVIGLTVEKITPAAGSRVDSRRQEWKWFYGATKLSIGNRGCLKNVEFVVSVYLTLSYVS